MAFYHILIHDRLVPLLRARGGRHGKELRKTLEFLQFGYWTHGVRVKALKGVPRPVYEARINKGDRLLFTVLRSPSTEPPFDLRHYLLAWDLVTHDELDRAKRLNVQPETGFLDFQSLAETELRAEPPVPDQLWPAQAGLRDGNLLDCLRDEPEQAPPATELHGSIRWYSVSGDIIADEDSWLDLLADPRLNQFELQLSPEQARILHAPGPILLRGSAGSGKTTVSVYRLARAVLLNPTGRYLYLTYSEALLELARRLYQDLFRVRQKEPPQPLPEFITFPALYAHLAELPEQAPLRYPAFAEWYRLFYKTQDAALAWEEIRGIIKGACGDLHRSHLNRREYEELGRKRAPLFAHDRPRIYGIFEKYQAWLHQQRRMDDIDLARAALKRLKQGGQGPWDGVFCDEGQDLTELELELLLSLVSAPANLFFAGDPQQIVNPSGFRWAELRGRLRQRLPSRQAPDLLALTRNYRSVLGIVALANAVLRLQRERTGRGDDDDLQESTLQGAPPVLVLGDEATVLRQLQDFGPRCAVLAPQAELVPELQRLLGTERVFDPVSAKGLEFEAVVLWNPLSAAPAQWEQLLLSQDDLKENPVARRALRYFYVSITRARRYLGIYEADPRALACWQSPWLRAAVERDQPEALAKFMLTAAKPADWRAEGDYFLERRRYRQAAECYRRAGEEDLALAADAAFYESLEDFASAARIYGELGLHARQAQAHEKAGQVAAAGPCYAQAGDWPNAARCFQAVQCWPEAHKAWREAGDHAQAQCCHLEEMVAARHYPQAAALARKLGHTSRAIELYERAGLRREALELRVSDLLAKGDWRTAGGLMSKAKHHAQALKLYKENHAEPALIAAEEAHLAEAAGKLTQAANKWRLAGDLNRALELDLRYAEQKKYWLKAAELHDQRGSFKDVMRCLKLAKGVPARRWRELLDSSDELRDHNCLTLLRQGRLCSAQHLFQFMRQERQSRHPRQIEKVMNLPYLEWAIGLYGPVSNQPPLTAPPQGMVFHQAEFPRFIMVGRQQGLDNASIYELAKPGIYIFYLPEFARALGDSALQRRAEAEVAEETRKRLAGYQVRPRKPRKAKAPKTARAAKTAMGTNHAVQPDLFAADQLTSAAPTPAGPLPPADPAATSEPPTTPKAAKTPAAKPKAAKTPAAKPKAAKPKAAKGSQTKAVMEVLQRAAERIGHLSGDPVDLIQQRLVQGSPILNPVLNPTLPGKPPPPAKPPRNS